MKYVLTIPGWTPPLLNKVMGRHWRKARRLKHETATLLGIYARIDGVPLATTRRRVALTAYGWQRGCLPDLDAFHKILLDALVNSGLLLDDDARGLEEQMVVRVVRSTDKFTEIELEDC